MRRPVLAIAAAVVFALAAVFPTAADLPARMPVVIVDQPGVPVRLTDIRPEVSLVPVDGTLTTVWFVRGAMTNVTSKRIVAIETAWALIDAHNETAGTVRNRNVLLLEPGERRLAVVGMITDFLYKPGARVVGLVRRVQFVDGSVWTPPPANVGQIPVPLPNAPAT